MKKEENGFPPSYLFFPQILSFYIFSPAAIFPLNGPNMQSSKIMKCHVNIQLTTSVPYTGVYILNKNHFPPPYPEKSFFWVRRAGGGILGGARPPPLLPAQRKIFGKWNFL